MRSLKCAVFDLSGVVIKYPNYAAYQTAIKSVGHNEEFKKAFHRYECGHSSMEEFPPLAARFKSVLERFAGFENAVLEDIMGPLDENIAKAIKRLRSEGVKVVLLTNNGFLSAERKRSLILRDLSDFDLTVESCRVGCRKPDPEIYEITTKQVGCRPEEIVFVDDLAVNVEAAERFGWIGIHLENDDSESAVRQLEKLFEITIL